MSFNTFGHMFRVTTFGESHGVALGCVVDGCPPQIPLTVEEIQLDLDRRRPGQSKYTTQRQEADQVKILSGVMDTDKGQVTGTPIALMIENTDQRSKDYGDIRTSSAPATPTTPMTRNTACAIIAAAAAPRRARRRARRRRRVARKVMPRRADHAARWCRWGRTRSTAPLGLGRGRPQPVLLPRCGGGRVLGGYLDGIRKAGSSIGAVIEVVAEGVPAGSARRSTASSTATGERR
jgi:chorismate synthase